MYFVFNLPPTYKPTYKLPKTKTKPNFEIKKKRIIA